MTKTDMKRMLSVAIIAVLGWLILDNWLEPMIKGKLS